MTNLSLAAFVLAVASSGPLFGQGTPLPAQSGSVPPLAGPTPGVAQGDPREAMWWSPSAEDWAKPCLVPWQRTWEDALRLAESTGKPLLVCVNMDGEIASEHYAGIRYRQPEIATIYEPYVTVIASVYRHTPRDYDEEGRRILCPRFGSVTCEEHIRIEPALYELFMDERRISPRHIMVDVERTGSGAIVPTEETYDVYYAFDTQSVFETIREGVSDRPTPPPTVDVEERTIEELVASPDNDDRTLVEDRYRRGDGALKRELLRAAIGVGGEASTDLMRLAVYDLDVELNRLARLALAQATTEGAIGLINEALRAPMSAEERDALIAALVRLGAQWPRARTLAAVHQGIAQESDSLDLVAWSDALRDSTREDGSGGRERRIALEYQLESKAQATRERTEDPNSLLEFAEATLELAVDPESTSSLGAASRGGTDYAQLLLEDVLGAASQAEQLGASGWRVDTTLAVASYYLGDQAEGYRRADAAVKAMPRGEASWSAMAVLALFAQSRQEAIIEAVTSKVEWPREWLADVNAAYSVLAAHPLARDHQVASNIDFLRWLGAFARAERALEAGMDRFPDSALLHERLRGRVLWEKGARALESVYEDMLAAEETSPNLSWFAGYASIVAAEFQRRGSNWAEARGAYDRAIAHFERAVQDNPENRASADHHIALAFAGRARIGLTQGELERALADLRASFAQDPDAAATLDSLELSAVATATTLRARLREAGRDDLADEVQAALDALDPVMLVPPAFEPRGAAGMPPRNGGRNPARFPRGAAGGQQGRPSQQRGGGER